MDKAKFIRLAKADDIPALKRIVEDTDMFPPEMLDDMMAGYLTDPECQDFWLTYDDNGPVAIAYCAPERMAEGTWNLYLIAVDPAHQGKGRGGAVMDHIEAALAGRGARILLVETSGLPEFARTRAFYDRCGYERAAVIRDFYAAGEDKVVFRKDLVAG